MSSHHDQIQTIANKLEEWDYKLDRLEHRLMDIPEGLRKTVHHKLEQVKQKRDQMLKRKAALQSGAGHAIHDAEESVEAVWDGVKLLFDEIELDVNVECS